MTNQMAENGANALAYSRRITLNLLDGFPDDKLCYQPFKDANHVLWMMGHLAWSDDLIMTQICGVKARLPEKWTELFGWGSKSSPDQSVYPDRAQLAQAMQTQRNALMEWIRSMSEAQLVKSLPTDYANFAVNYGALPASITWHEGFHAGQIAMIRKALGFEPKMT